MSKRIELQNKSFRFKYATLDQIQFVWAEVSKGQTTIRKICQKANWHHEFVLNILHFLEKCGYVEHTFGKTGWKVILPLVTVERKVDCEAQSVKPVPASGCSLRAPAGSERYSVVKGGDD